ncbi:MAG: DUF4367 domain-containing protein [Candidatus Saccharibacteria bacterium]|nr:DUF4367 domain-containing protein [Candidatus Saccharibacteria bacterium]
MSQTIRLNGKVYDIGTGKAVRDGDQKRHEEHRHTAHAVHSRTQTAKTLMRGSVKKPKIVVDLPAKTTDHHVTPQSTLSPLNAHQRREQVAMRTEQSHLIRRFNPASSARAGVVSRHEVVAVRPAPGSSISHHAAPPIVALTPKSEVNFFASALNEAKAHQQATKHHKTRRHSKKTKAMALSATIMTTMVLGGFFLWQNSANVEFRMAASRAGIQASLPDYRPSGFAIKGPVEFAPGQVKVSFSSNSDERKFSITQQSSNWNSDALKETVAAAAPGGYETKQTKGKTVYIFNGSNATWVDGGIWYQIESNSGLSTDQLLNIAASM